MFFLSLFGIGKFEFNTHLYTKYESNPFFKTAYLDIENFEYSNSAIVSRSFLDLIKSSVESLLIF